mmetsp:Transcript_29337/g.75852  ORF Transcript_29337/g.75852 Transcript_29337/m.75852 type:complete len:190 (-) Transcript_29337:102-671(-)
MPNQFVRPNQLPPVLQQLKYSLKLGDEKRSGCERDWDTTYDETINLTVRAPSSKKTPLAAAKLRYYSTGFVLTDTQRDAVEEVREQVFLRRVWESLPLDCTASDKAKEAANVFHAADEAKLGILARDRFIECLEGLGVYLSRHDMNALVDKFAIERIACIRAVDYIEFICKVLPEAYNKLGEQEKVMLC